MDSGQSDKDKGDESSCWRTLDGERLCSGSSHSLDLAVSVPVVLLIELCGRDADNWNVPPRLQLVTKKNQVAGESLTDSYQLAGRILWSESGSHFMTRLGSLSKGGRIYEYDDMKNDGYAQILKDSKFSVHLAGKGINANYQPGFTTNFVVYYLAGGTSAQERFLAHQVRCLDSAHHVQLSNPTLSSLMKYSLTFTKLNTHPVQSSQRNWHRDPQRTDVADYEDKPGYIATTPPVQPSRRAKRKHTQQKGSSEGKTVDFITISSTESTTSPSESPILPSSNGSSSDLSPNQPTFPFPYPSLPQSSVTKVPTSEPTLPLTDPRSRKRALALINSKDSDSDISGTLPISFTFALDCRCGRLGDATIIDAHLAKILCMSCHKWSHVACQTDGRADFTSSGNGDFICDDCL